MIPLTIKIKWNYIFITYLPLSNLFTTVVTNFLLKASLLPLFTEPKQRCNSLRNIGWLKTITTIHQHTSLAINEDGGMKHETMSMIKRNLIDDYIPCYLARWTLIACQASMKPLHAHLKVKALLAPVAIIKMNNGSHHGSNGEKLYTLQLNISIQNITSV